MRSHTLWLLALVCAVLLQGGHATTDAGDLAALEAFRAGITNSAFHGHVDNLLSDWTGDDPCVDWSDITCNVDRVTGISLAAKGLEGTIARELGNAIELTSLQLGDNALSDTLPARLCNLYQLTSLRVENNVLSGTLPDCMGVLAALTDVRVSNNVLDGAIPGGFAHLAALTTLHLQDNALTGELPDFSAMTGLTELRADNNFLEGSIPASIGAATLLTTLHLSGNNLEGALPSLSSLTALTSLLLHGNALETALDPAYFGTHTFTTLSVEVTGDNTIYCDASEALPACDPSGCGVTSPCVCEPGKTGVGACDLCVGGYYGVSCDPCPGVADGNECYGFGTCDSGTTSSGLCPSQLSGFEDALWDDAAGENTLVLVGPAASTVDATHVMMITGDASCDGAPAGPSGNLGAAPWVTFKGTLDIATNAPPYRVCYSTEGGADGTWMDQDVDFTPIFGMSDLVVRPFDYEHTWEMRVYDNDVTDFDTLRRSHPAVLESGILSIVWGSSFPEGASSASGFGVRLGGRLEFPTAEVYTLTLRADNAARVIVDGAVETERWTPNNAVGDLPTFTVDASIRPIVDVVIEYSHTSGTTAEVTLSWETVTVTKRVVPVSSMYASFGCVLDLNGGDTDWFEAAEPALPVEPAFTVAFWVRPNMPPLGEGVVLSVASDMYQQLLDVSLHADSEELGVSLTVCDVTWDTKVPVVPTEWSHVAIAADLDSGSALLLVNGVTRAEAFVSGFFGASLTEGTSHRLAIGQRWDAALPTSGVETGAGVDGSIAYVTLMNGADPEEARLHMTMEPLEAEHVVWHYRFDDCYATSPDAVVADRVGASDLSRAGSGNLPLSLPGAPLGHLQRGVRLLGSNTHVLQRRHMRDIHFRAGAAMMIRVRIDAAHVEDDVATLVELADVDATGTSNILALRYRHSDDTLLVQSAGSHEFTTAGIVLGQWHTIFCSHDGSTTLTCYRDDATLGTGILSTPSNGGITSRAWLTIGGTVLVGRSIQGRLLGAVDDVKIWNRALDATAAAAEMCNSHAARRDTSVVAHYDFTGVWVEDTAGEDWTLHDLSGRGNHLQLIGTLDMTNAIPIPRTTIVNVCGGPYDLGCALETRGDLLRRVVHVGDLAEGGTINSLTVSYWLRLDELSGVQTIFGYTSSSSTFTEYIGAEVDANGDHYLSVSGLTVKCQSTSLEAGRWYHILLSYDSADRLCHSYVDGSLDQNTADLGAPNVVAAEPANDIATLSLGWEQGFVHADEPLIGALDMFRLWINQGRVDSDIADAACITDDVLPAESLRYDFDECAMSSRVSDATGNGEDALVLAEGRADFSLAPPNVACLDMSSSSGVLQHYSPFEGVYSLFEPAGSWPHSGEDITVALWVFPVQRGLSEKTLYQHSDGTANHLWITVNSNGQIEVTTYNGVWSGGVGSVGAVPVGEWTHVTVVLQDLATDTLDVYINGVSDHSGTLPNSAPFMPPATGGDYVTVGHRFAGGNSAYDVFPSDHLQGFTDRVMVWSRALGSGEVADVPCSAALPETNLVARWEFNDVARPETDGLADSSGNSFTLHMLLHDDSGDELLPPLPAWAPPAARFDTVDSHNAVLGVCQDVGLCATGTGCCGGDVECGGAGICVEGACVCNDCTYGSHCIGVDTECVAGLLQRVTPDVVVEEDAQQYAEFDFGDAPLVTQGAELMWEVLPDPLDVDAEESELCEVAQTQLSSEPFTVWSNFLDDALLFDAEQDGGPLEILARSSSRVGVWEQSAALNEFAAGDDVVVSAESPVVFDRDGDGALEFVWCIAGSSITEYATLGGGGTDLITDGAVSCSAGMVAVDVNGDSWVDLIEGRGNTLVWHRNNAGGASFSQSVGTLYNDVTTIFDWQVTDIDRDGAVDVTLLAGSGVHWCAPSSITATGVWTCDVVVASTFGTGDQLSVSDVNGDGMPDLLATIAGGGVDLFLQTSVFSGAGMDTPTFSGQQVSSDLVRACFAPSSLRDVLPVLPDDERITPILCELDGNLVEFEPPSAGLLSGAWSSQEVLPTVGRVDRFFAADVNADGRTDLVALRSKSSSVAVWPQMVFSVNGGHSTPLDSSTASTRLLNKLYVDSEFGDAREIQVCVSVDGGEGFHAQTGVSMWVGRGDTAVRELDPARKNEATTPSMTLASIGLLGSAQHAPRQLALSVDSTCTLDGVATVLNIDPGLLGALSETSPLFAVADFNNDGLDDVLHARTGDASVRAWLLQSDGDHFAFSDLDIAGYSVFNWVSLTPLHDGDGVVRMFVSFDAGTRLWTFEHGGMGISSDVSVTSTSYTNVVTGRLDADGSACVYVENGGDIDVWSSTASVETTAVLSVTSVSPQMATGDFDGDGVDELVFGDGTDLMLAQSDDPLSVAFAAASINTDVSSGIESLAVGDVTGDGALDVMYVDDTAVRLIVNSATTGLTFQSTPVVVDATATGASARSLRLVDLDADGDLDVLLMLSDDLYWYENTVGDGTAWTETALGLGGASRSSVVHTVHSHGRPGAVFAIDSGLHVRVTDTSANSVTNAPMGAQISTLPQALDASTPGTATFQDYAVCVSRDGGASVQTQSLATFRVYDKYQVVTAITPSVVESGATGVRVKLTGAAISDDVEFGFLLPGEDCSDRGEVYVAEDDYRMRSPGLRLYSPGQLNSVDATHVFVGDEGLFQWNMDTNVKTVIDAHVAHIDDINAKAFSTYTRLTYVSTDAALLGFYHHNGAFVHTPMPALSRWLQEPTMVIGNSLGEGSEKDIVVADGDRVLIFFDVDLDSTWGDAPAMLSFEGERVSVVRASAINLPSGGTDILVGLFSDAPGNMRVFDGNNLFTGIDGADPYGVFSFPYPTEMRTSNVDNDGTKDVIAGSRYTNRVSWFKRVGTTFVEHVVVQNVVAPFLTRTIGRNALIATPQPPYVVLANDAIGSYDENAASFGRTPVHTDALPDKEPLNLIQQGTAHSIAVMYDDGVWVLEQTFPTIGRSGGVYNDEEGVVVDEMPIVGNTLVMDLCLKADAGLSALTQQVSLTVNALNGGSAPAFGDPHFGGFHGGWFDFHGTPGRVYNLLSDTNVQLNARFVHINGGDMPGYYMSELGLKLGPRTRILYRRDGQVTITPFTRDTAHPARVLVDGGGSVEWAGADLHVLYDVYRIDLRRFAGVVESERNNIELHHVAYRLWFDRSRMEREGTWERWAPHGVHGQTGRVEAVVVGRGVQGEGVIEGSPEDYHVAGDDLFGDGFAFNQFAPKQRVTVPASPISAFAHTQSGYGV